MPDHEHGAPSPEGAARRAVALPVARSGTCRVVSGSTITPRPRVTRDGARKALRQLPALRSGQEAAGCSGDRSPPRPDLRRVARMARRREPPCAIAQRQRHRPATRSRSLGRRAAPGREATATADATQEQQEADGAAAAQRRELHDRQVVRLRTARLPNCRGRQARDRARTRSMPAAGERAAPTATPGGAARAGCRRRDRGRQRRRQERNRRRHADRRPAVDHRFRPPAATRRRRPTAPAVERLLSATRRTGSRARSTSATTPARGRCRARGRGGEERRGQTEARPSGAQRARPSRCRRRAARCRA